MIGQVTILEAGTISRYFKAAGAARQLNALAEDRRLTNVERRQLQSAEDERDALRPIVAEINTRSFATQQAA